MDDNERIVDNVFDYAGNEAIAEEAREVGRSRGLRPPVVSAGIDLLMNFARRGEVGRAETLVKEVAEEAAQTRGWHGWLWELRLEEAHAEIALARGDWQAALHWTAATMLHSQMKHRPKYETLGLWTRGQALAARGRTSEAIRDLRRAIDLARPLGDPALFPRPATALLAIEGDDVLLAQACASVKTILAGLPDEDMRRRFREAEPVQCLARSGNLA